MRNSYSLRKQIREADCSELLGIFNKCDIQIGKLGGRRIYRRDKKNLINFNASVNTVIKKLVHLSNSIQPSEVDKLENALLWIKARDEKGDQLLSDSNFLKKRLTKIMRFFGSGQYNRMSSIRTIEERIALLKNNPSAITPSAPIASTSPQIQSNQAVSPQRITTIGSANQFKVVANIISHLQRRQPLNGLEYVLNIVKDNPALSTQFEIDDQALFKDVVDQNKPESGMNFAGVNSLFSHYFKEEACFGSNGVYLAGKNPTGKVAYTPMMRVSKNPNGAYKLIKGILELELRKNNHQRPSKIMIPMTWEQDGIGHITLLVIEPSRDNLTEARITMVNTNGDSPVLFKAFEQEAMRAALGVYNSKKSTVLRNEKTIYTTGTSCGHDVIELARQLAQAPNAQEVVARGLKRKTPEQDRQIRVQHGKDLLAFYNTYS